MSRGCSSEASLSREAEKYDVELTEEGLKELVQLALEGSLQQVLNFSLFFVCFGVP